MIKHLASNLDRKETSVDTIEVMTARERAKLVKRFRQVHLKNEKERIELLMKKGVFDGKA